MPRAHDVEPIVGEHFTACYLTSHTIDQYLGAAARNTPQPRVPQSLEHITQRQFGHLREVVNLGWAEAMDIHLRKAVPNITATSLHTN